MKRLTLTAAAFALALGASVMADNASAMPIDSQLAATAPAAPAAQQVRWVCGPYRCWWQPGPYYGWHRWGGWGWHRWGGGWHRWGGWGWHRHWS